MDATTSPAAQPLTPADYRELRAAAKPGGLRVIATGDEARRIERLDRLNQRRLIAFGGVRLKHRGRAEILYSLSEAGRAVFSLH